MVEGVSIAIETSMFQAKYESEYACYSEDFDAARLRRKQHRSEWEPAMGESKIIEHHAVPPRTRYLLFGLVLTFSGIVKLWLWSDGSANNFGLYLGALFTVAGPYYLWLAWRSRTKCSHKEEP